MKKRVDLDVRPYPSPVRKNYDYGEGFYHGSMNRFKSVRDFLNKRKSLRAKKKTIAEIVLEIEKFANEVLKLG
jgi:hypothetical protein